MKWVVSTSPHIHRNISIKKIMYTVNLCLLFPFLGGIYFFGVRVLYMVAISVVSAMIAEALAQTIMRRKLTIFDGSAILTGILLAFNLPKNAPLWIPAVGSFFGILVAKQAFGGLGYNFINPALAGRAFLMASWPEIMTHKWSATMRGTMSGIESFTQATPLGVVKNYAEELNVIRELNEPETLINLFIGNHGGCVGETSVFLILIGGIILITLKYIDWRIPFCYIVTVGILTHIFYLIGITPVTGLFHILAGGLFLGAFFMATDYVTSPVTHKGRVIFGIMCGIITVLIRMWGGYPEGVCYSILLMNLFVPFIDKKIKPKKLGEIKK